MLDKNAYSLGLAIYFGIWFGVPLLVFLIYMLRRIRVVEQGTVMVVERLGTFHRQATGFVFLVPFLDRPRRFLWRTTYITSDNRYGSVRQTVSIQQTRSDVVDVRENVYNLPSQEVITRDNVQLSIHPMILYRVADPVRACYETTDLSGCVEKLVQASLRSLVGEMGLDDTLASREEIENGLRAKIAHTALDWGLEIKSVELLEITPTATVQSAMHQQLAAERVRRAAIVSAEGFREKLKLQAEGECQSAIALATAEKAVTTIRAQALADGRRLIAKAEADAVRTIGGSLAECGVEPTSYAVALKYIDALVSLAGSARWREVFFPLTTDVSGALAAVGAKPHAA